MFASTSGSGGSLQYPQIPTYYSGVEPKLQMDGLQYSQPSIPNSSWAIRMVRNPPPTFAPFGPSVRPPGMALPSASPQQQGMPWAIKQPADVDAMSYLHTTFVPPMTLNSVPQQFREKRYNQDPLLIGPKTPPGAFSHSAGTGNKFGRRDLHHSSHNQQYTQYSQPSYTYGSSSQTMSSFGPHGVGSDVPKMASLVPPSSSSSSRMSYNNSIATPESGGNTERHCHQKQQHQQQSQRQHSPYQQHSQYVRQRRPSRSSVGSSSTIMTGSNALNMDGSLEEKQHQQTNTTPGSAPATRNRSGSFRNQQDFARGYSSSPSAPAFASPVLGGFHPHILAGNVHNALQMGVPAPARPHQMRPPFPAVQQAYAMSFITAAPGNIITPATAGFIQAPLGMPQPMQPTGVGILDGHRRFPMQQPQPFLALQQQQQQQDTPLPVHQNSQSPMVAGSQYQTQPPVTNVPVSHNNCPESSEPQQQQQQQQQQLTTEPEKQIDSTAKQIEIKSESGIPAPSVADDHNQQQQPHQLGADTKT
ncbi:hypothetical protein EV182_004864, partial [Spiromyces aspiralis]